MHVIFRPLADLSGAIWGCGCACNPMEWRRFEVRRARSTRRTERPPPGAPLLDGGPARQRGTLEAQAVTTGRSDGRRARLPKLQARETVLKAALESEERIFLLK